MTTKSLGFTLTLALALTTLSYVDSASAAKPVCPGPHPSCDGDGGGGGVVDTYTMDITGEIEDENASGDSGTILLGKPKGVNANDLAGLPTIITTDTIRAHLYGSPIGTECFPADEVQLNPQVGIYKGKKGRAEAHLWFRGETSPMGTDDILYGLILIGAFDDPDTDCLQSLVIQA